MTITRRGVSESFAKSAPDDGQPGSISWETALLRRARDGEAGAFGELLRFYEARVFSLVHRYVHRRDEAAEVAQEVFLQAFKSSHRFEEGKPFRPWLFKIAINVCRNHRRAAARRELPTDLATDVEPMWASPALDGEQRADARETSRALSAAMRQIPHDDRALLLLRFGEGLNYDELRQVYARPQSVLKMRVHRAIKRLRLAATATLEEALQ